MHLELIDWLLIIFFLIIYVIIGTWATKKAGSSSSEFFLSGRNMSWLLLGVSMVATTFSIDTPNLVTDIVRQNGVAGNWVWWAFLLTGMLTVFIYAKLWRRSNVMTDIEFYELRYSGKPAAFLRGFRTIYLGLFFNIVIMAAVTLAAIKVGTILLNLSPLETILIAGGVTVIYSSLGGLLGVLLTDFVQFIIAMIGSIAAAYYAVNHPKVGGLSNLLSNPNVTNKLSFLPDFHNTEMVIVVLIIPFAVQWWSVWYPGSEPGGGGYIAQRMLAAKNEKNAAGATLLFNASHYALRPWPWILVALASLVVFPDLQSIRTAFPYVNPDIVKNDLAYPAMLTFLPPGLLGLAVASLIAAYMSTMSTSLNWGSSYVVNDFYRRFIRPSAPEKELVRVGRISTIIMMICASFLALFMQNALQVFNVLLQIGAGTGLLFILRWFWWRVNAYSEISAMVVSFLVAVFFFIQKNIDSSRIAQLIKDGMETNAATAQVAPLKDWQELVIGVAITTISWLVVTFITKPTDNKKLVDFYKLIHPSRKGWKKIVAKAQQDGEEIIFEKSGDNLPLGILCMLVGCIGVYSILFATGFWIYSNILPAVILSITAIASGVFIVKKWDKVIH
jgi:solute:Na+ symporter, SSS family